MSDSWLAPLELKASGDDFSYALRLDTGRPLVLEGDAGYSRKSERGQASYYYSQPYFKASGRIIIDDKPTEVTGQA
jgi:predicted secreted hydrolase